MTFGPDFSLDNHLNEQFDLPEDSEERFLALKKEIESHAQMINRKDTGQYEESEVIVNQTFPGNTPQDKRSVFRLLVPTGAIAQGATGTIGHNIAAFTNMTTISGTVITDVVDYRPIPYASTVALNEQISVTVDDTNVVIVNGGASPNITSGFVLLEFVKN